MKKFICILSACVIAGCVHEDKKEALQPSAEILQQSGSTVSKMAKEIEMNLLR
tara:strand:+ start:35 stop:193 length:159 start_codon:yes stop_codon:yes gene_type:complete